MGTRPSADPYMRIIGLCGAELESDDKQKKGQGGGKNCLAGEQLDRNLQDDLSEPVFSSLWGDLGHMRILRKVEGESAWSKMEGHRRADRTGVKDDVMLSIV